MSIKDDKVSKHDPVGKSSNIDESDKIVKTSSVIQTHDSEVSLGFPTPSNNVKSIESDTSVFLDLYSSISFSSQKRVENIYCLAVVCIKHSRIALRSLSNQCFFLPFVTYNENVTFEQHFKELVTCLVADIEGKITKPKLIDFYRFKRPRTSIFYTRYIFKSNLFPTEQAEDLKENCCTNKDNIKWLTLAEVEKALQTDTNYPGHTLWGDEPLKILLSNNNFCLREATINDAVNLNEPLLQSLNCSSTFLSNLLDDYLCHSYPSSSMSFASFVAFCGMLHKSSQTENSFRNNFPLEKITNLYNSFKIHEIHKIRFQEFLCGFLAMDKKLASKLNEPITKLNQGPYRYMEAVKLNYLFRYYDSNIDGFMKPYEIVQLLHEYIDEVESNNIKELPVWLKKTQSRYEMLMKTITRFGTKEQGKEDYILNYNQVRQVLLEVFCANNENITHILTVLFVNPFDLIEHFSSPSTASVGQWDQQVCRLCRNISYQHANHLIRLSINGGINWVMRIDSSGPDSRIQIADSEPEESIPLLANDLLIRIQQLHSYTKRQSSQQELVDNWFFPDKKSKLEAITLLVDQAKRIFSKERRVFDISSPCYVIGDIHGDLDELTTYSHSLWRESPFLNLTNYLFLGNYVNHGRYSIEVVCMLFCFKILAPKHFLLLRGHHEVRKVQKQLSFYNECTNYLSKELWNSINEAFDCLPIAARVDKRFFCANGGIPNSVNSIMQLLRIPCPLGNPIDCSLVEEILQSKDPKETKEVSVAKFNERNTIECIIRSNKVFAEGFSFNFGGNMITISSSNDSKAVLFIDEGKIRIVQHIKK